MLILLQSDDIAKNRKKAEAAEKDLEATVEATELEWTKLICNGLLSSSACFLELFQAGDKALKRCEEENNDFKAQLDKQVAEKKQRSSGGPQMFRRVDSSDFSSRRDYKFTIGGSRTASGPSTPPSLNRRRSCRFDAASVTRALTDERSPRSRPLSFHLRVSSPDLKAAMLQAIPEKISTKTSKAASSGQNFFCLPIGTNFVSL